jgi:murein DD-endopeptidase MepM/ murein hydrolase activator NlpD
VRASLKFSAILVFTVLVLGGGAWWWAGRMPGPHIEIRQPDRFIGQASALELKVDAPGARFSQVDVSLEQGGKSYPLFGLDQRGQSEVRQETPTRLSITRRVGKRDVPQLQAGPARIVVRAARPVLFGLRQAASEASRDVQVRLEPPRVAALSTFHYINQGGAEFVVYRATPTDVDSGVHVGDQTYPGFAATGAGIKGDDAAMRVAFFALLHDQDVNASITLYARDAAGNEMATPLDHRIFPKPFAHSRIEIADQFLQRIVPAIAATTPDMGLSTAPQDLVVSFLRINGELRRRNNQTIAEQAKKTRHEMLWKDAFQPLGNAAVEAKFADNRTYFYQGREIDRQVHLGFDLAVTAHIPVLAANRGVVLYASDLGIYGNCVIVDHGLGVQSLYAHLSSIDVKVGDTVEKGNAMGRSGMTGLAAGDHLHFTMLVNGHPVNPVEWWDTKWMQDRVLRKIQAAGAEQ